MKFISQWMGEGSRKRPAEESSQENSRKRTRDDSGRRESNATGIGSVTDQEYKIAGSATATKDTEGFLHSSLPTEPLPAPSPPIHPDRLANICNPTPTSAPAPTTLENKRDAPLSPLSPSTEHVENADQEEQRPEPLHSTSHPNLCVDTGQTVSGFDPPSPHDPPVMTSQPSEKSHHGPSHDPRRPSMDSYRPINHPLSRRQSDTVPPPPNASKVIRSETSTSNATSPPINSELERQKLSTAQPQVPLLDSLNGFAQSIMSAASLTVRLDLVKQQAVGQQKERGRQSRLKPTFLTLIEDAESRVEGAEKLSSGIEKQMQLSSEAQSKIAIGLASQLQKAEIPDAPSSVSDQGRLKNELADIKADLKAAGKDNIRERGRFKEDLADIKVDLKAARKEIGYLNREAVTADELHKKLRGLARKDELPGVPTKDELRRVTTDEVRKHVTEALVPTEKKLASLTVETTNLNQKIEGVEGVTHKYHVTAEEQDKQGTSRFGRLDTSLKEMQMVLSRLQLIVQEQKQDSATVKVDLEAQNKVLTDLDTYVRCDPSNEDPSLDKLVMRNSEQIQRLQQRCEEFAEAVVRTQDLRATSNIESSPQIPKASVKADTRIMEEVKIIGSDVDALKQDFNLIRHDLDALKTDGENDVLIRMDLDSLINEEKLKDAGVVEGFEKLEESLNKQYEDLARLQNEVRLVRQSQASQTILNHPPTPPCASASTSPRESDHQKLQDLEIALRKLTKITQGLELFVNSQQQKFDGLTSDRVVQSMVHQMQQMYPQHSGNLVALVNQTVTRQARVDSYLSGILKDRLANIDSQVAARVGTDSKIEETTQFTVESRRILLAALNSLKQDIEELKVVALNVRPQEPSDNGTRINELADRMTTVEARYVKAISDFQTNQTDLLRNVTHLQYRNGTASTRNTPGELTVMSRSSKSAEPNGSAISHKNFNDSDSSDTSLSQRSDRGVRRDGEERRPTDPNLKRKAVDFDEEDSDGEDSDEGGKARPTKAKKVPKRRNVSGKNPFS